MDKTWASIAVLKFIAKKREFWLSVGIALFAGALGWLVG
jgi:hypothetical protein